MKKSNLAKTSTGLMMLLLVFFVSCESIVDNHQFDSSDPSTGSIVALSMHEGLENGEEAKTITLFAGQDMDVGAVNVSNDGDYIYVEYVLNQDAIDEGWCITETHVHVGTSLTDFPLGGRWGNPAPGQFDYKTDHDPCVESYEYEIPIGDWEAGDKLLIGAHAAIEKVECVTLAEAPYGGTRIVDTFQAWRIDHDPVTQPRPVRDERSYPDNVLEIGTPGQETFYSLGYGGVLNAERTAVETFFGKNFDDRGDPAAIREMEEWVDDDLAAELSDTENNAGWIIIEFDYPILNVEGEYDLQVVEDTWGLPYPLELAAVFGRADANDDWTFLFLAHNQQPVGTPLYHTYTNGTLGDLDQAVQILVQDVSDPEWFIPYPHNEATLDGYDLNAVVALNDHEVCTVYDETAWGAFDVGDIRFTEQGNWATYFKYTIQEQYTWLESVDVPSTNAEGVTTQTVLEEEQLYRFRASGTFTYNNAGDWADAEWYLKDGDIVKGDTEGSVPWVLDVSVKDYVENIDWGDYDPDHVYYYEFTGTGEPVNFFIHDSFYGDNEGSIKVDIYRINW